jgi:hypothetical protein
VRDPDAYLFLLKTGSVWPKWHTLRAGKEPRQSTRVEPTEAPVQGGYGSARATRTVLLLQIVCAISVFRPLSEESGGVRLILFFACIGSTSVGPLAFDVLPSSLPSSYPQLGVRVILNFTQRTNEKSSACRTEHLCSPSPHDELLERLEITLLLVRVVRVSSGMHPRVLPSAPECSPVIPECSRVLMSAPQSAPECSPSAPRVPPECSRVLPSHPRVLPSAPRVPPSHHRTGR